MDTASVELRRVTEEDAHLLWTWANDPAVRASAFAPEPIPWEEHQRWLARKLADNGCQFYIGEEQDGTPVGQIRFDRVAPGEAEIDISIDPTRRGRRQGVALLQAGVARAFSGTDLEQLHAYIRPENTASQRAFSGAGFTKLDPVQIRGCEAEHFRITRKREP